jgi:hypothetical protein
MQWQSSSRVRPASGFTELCIPTKVASVPVGPDWVYEIKHDGYPSLKRSPRLDDHGYANRRGCRDRADFCRCFKTGAAVFLHDDGIVAHSTYGNTLILIPGPPLKPSHDFATLIACANAASMSQSGASSSRY